MLLLTLPWSGWLLVAAPRAVRTLTGTRARLSEVDWLMLLWLATIVVFFSLPHSKLIGYVLPALPPLAYFIARALQAVGAGSAVRRTTAGVAVVCCLAALVAAGTLGKSPGHALRLPAGERPAPQDQVLMLGDYWYGLPLYWRLTQPVRVVADWRQRTATASDNWQKEFHDAGQFEPALRDRLLLDIEGLHRALCAAPTTWVLGPPTMLDPASPWRLTTPALATARPLASSSDVALWRIDRDALRAAGYCPETPTSGSPRK